MLFFFFVCGAAHASTQERPKEKENKTLSIISQNHTICTQTKPKAQHKGEEKKGKKLTRIKQAVQRKNWARSPGKITELIGEEKTR